MASGGSDTNGAVYASLGHVVLIIILAAVIAAVLSIAMGWLHRLANPSARPEKVGIPLMRLKMFAAWPIEYLVIGWNELTHCSLRFSRYKPRHAR